MTNRAAVALLERQVASRTVQKGAILEAAGVAGRLGCLVARLAEALGVTRFARNRIVQSMKPVQPGSKRSRMARRALRAVARRAVPCLDVAAHAPIGVGHRCNAVDLAPVATIVRLGRIVRRDAEVASEALGRRSLDQPWKVTRKAVFHPRETDPGKHSGLIDRAVTLRAAHRVVVGVIEVRLGVIGTRDAAIARRWQRGMAGEAGAIDRAFNVGCHVALNA